MQRPNQKSDSHKQNGNPYMQTEFVNPPIDDDDDDASGPSKLHNNHLSKFKGDKNMALTINKSIFDGVRP
jgi:hypothetical protein